MQAIDARTSSSAFEMLSPFTQAVPLVGMRRVVRILMRVVFPAPFGPRRPKTSPSNTSRSTALRATTSFFRFRWPFLRSFEMNVFDSLSALIIGSAMESASVQVGGLFKGQQGDARHVRGRGVDGHRSDLDALQVSHDSAHLPRNIKRDSRRPAIRSTASGTTSTEGLMIGMRGTSCDRVVPRASLLCDADDCLANETRCEERGLPLVPCRAHLVDVHPDEARCEGVHDRLHLEGREPEGLRVPHCR